MQRDCGGAWETHYCPAHAICVHTARYSSRGLCSCEYVTTSMTDGSDGECYHSEYTIAFLIYWIILLMALVLLTSFAVRRMFLIHRNGQFKLGDSLVLTSLLVIGCCISFILVCVVRIIWPFIKTREQLDQLQVAFVFLQLLLVFNVIVLICFFSGSLLTILFRSSDYPLVRAHRRRVVGFVAVFSVFAVCCMAPLMFDKQYALQSVYASAWALISVLFLYFVPFISRHVFNRSQPGEPFSQRAVNLVLKACKKLLTYLLFFFLGNCGYSACWFIGREQVSRTLLGPASALFVALIFISVLLLLASLFNSVFDVMRERAADGSISRVYDSGVEAVAKTLGLTRRTESKLVIELKQNRLAAAERVRDRIQNAFESSLSRKFEEPSDIGSSSVRSVPSQAHPSHSQLATFPASEFLSFDRHKEHNLTPFIDLRSARESPRFVRDVSTHPNADDEVSSIEMECLLPRQNPPARPESSEIRPWFNPKYLERSLSWGLANRFDPDTQPPFVLRRSVSELTLKLQREVTWRT